MMIALFLLALVATAYAGTCDNVNCDKSPVYFIDRYKHECRFKFIDGPTENRKGLEFWRYSDKYDPNDPDQVIPDTQVCEYSTRLLTRTPRKEDGLIFKGRSGGGWPVFSECCAPTVMNACRHSVRLIQDCRQDGNGDDRMRRVEATYKHFDLEKVIEVEFHAFYHYMKARFWIGCTSPSDCKSKFTTPVQEKQFYLKEKANYNSPGDDAFFLIGDNDLKVALNRQLDGNGHVQLKASREQCLSQYVSMIDEEGGKNGNYKITMRTAFEKPDKYIDGVSMYGILGETEDGLCGKVARNVWLDQD